MYSEETTSDGAKARVDWVDYAKGWCIILVVMMHSTLGVEEAMGRESWLHGFIEWARPFRMPDFFLVAGLFLSRTIDRPWRDYLDRKVLHFGYFYVLWTLIQGVPKLSTRPGRRSGRRAFRPRTRYGRTIRHAVVHLSAAHFLHRHQADAPRPGRSRACRGGDAADGADTYGLDGDRRIRRALCLFLRGLRLRAADFRFRGSRACRMSSRRSAHCLSGAS